MGILLQKLCKTAQAPLCAMRRGVQHSGRRCSVGAALSAFAGIEPSCKTRFVMQLLPELIAAVRYSLTSA